MVYLRINLFIALHAYMYEIIALCVKHELNLTLIFLLPDYVSLHLPRNRK